ncbi:hypothetical protein [Streptomyces sp. HNM0574]|uniref:hypothetical protein n=1 Tax=Streptomyces sp. HNM0574 TaxID=2714954 RepID=UPI00146A373A|nr:hypothetical protein [Streptomyces sp. HNM0574]NLU69456.1 hypothetical protein [Streptomyces sp. HNM0574]
MRRPATPARDTRTRRLLLLAALLFGLFTMHTLGHPTDPGGPGAVAEAQPGAGEGELATATQARTPDAAPEPHDPAHSTGTDPAAVCVAVHDDRPLTDPAAACSVAGVGGEGVPSAVARAGAPLAERPEPPPRGELLAGMSVLRR